MSDDDFERRITFYTQKVNLMKKTEKMNAKEGFLQLQVFILRFFWSNKKTCMHCNAVLCATYFLFWKQKLKYTARNWTEQIYVNVFYYATRYP